jgi:hypothetical protein
MTAWARAGRTAEGLPRRSWSKMSEVAPLATASARGAPWRRNRPFRSREPRAILTQCRNPTHCAVLASNGAYCRTISTSSPVHGRGSDGLPRTMLNPKPSVTSLLEAYLHPHPLSDSLEAGEEIERNGTDFFASPAPADPSAGADRERRQLQCERAIAYLN